MHQDVLRAIGAGQSQRVRELGNARTELQQALVRFTELQEEERGAIAQALHDETIQALLATLWALEELEPTTDVVGRIRRNLEAAVTAARSMVRDLRPPALDELGVVAAVEQELQRLADETGIAVCFEGAVGGRLPTHVETLTFRTAQEVLRNVRRHGSASSVQVMMERRDDVLYVEVQDDGMGGDPALLSGDSRPHAGIVAMRENIVTCGGNFSIGPRPGRGTVVRFSLPGQ